MVRAEGSYGTPPRPRLRCFHTGDDGKARKHGFRPAAASGDAWGALPGGKYVVADVADALVDIARGSSYTDAARRAQLARGRVSDPDAEASALDGRLVATWVDRFAGAIQDAYAERAWPPTLVLDSTEFTWTNPRTGKREQMFTVLGAWGYPAGAKRGRLWALRAAPSDTGEAWQALLQSLPGTPELVIYDSDKGVEAAVPKVWPTTPVYLCEHHLYVNGRKHLRNDGQHGMGNVYRALLASAGQSYAGWSAFRNAVLADPALKKTGAWVTARNEQMTMQSARRPRLPQHHSTGALDPHLAKVREVLEPRAWTYRNLDRMNALLGLVRLSINLHDRPSDWAQLIGEHLHQRPRPVTFDEPPTIAPDGWRSYSLRTHRVPPQEKSTSKS